LEASTLTHAQRRGLFARRSPLLKFQSDDSLVALTRRGHQHAFEALVERYQSRLLGFCRQMLRSTEDAEDVLQEVFVASYNAMIADERTIAVRPWLYRIARNRCLNHLRKPKADGQDTMDTMPHMNGVTTLERVQDREEFRELLDDVSHLPETQRSALLLREIDAMSYEEIAQAMDTTVPGVKSLLVRARIALAESSQARQLTCGEVRVELAEAAEGLAKVSGPVRRHIKACEPCTDFRKQLRSDSKALAAIFPAGPLLALKGVLVAKVSGVFGGASGGAAGSGSAAGAGAAAAGAGGAGATAAGGAAAVGGAAAAGSGAATAATAVGAAITTKAAAGLATAAIVTAGAVEVQHFAAKDPINKGQNPPAKAAHQPKPAPAAIVPVTTTPAEPVAQPTDEAKPEEVVVDPATTADDSSAPATVEDKPKHKTAVTGTGDADTKPAGPVTTGVSPGCDGADASTNPACEGGVTTEVTPAAPAEPVQTTPKIKRVRHQQGRGRSPSAAARGTVQRRHVRHRG
jgi:RNA polymerase sigma factor (sigma-70 family)